MQALPNITSEVKCFGFQISRILSNKRYIRMTTLYCIEFSIVLKCRIRQKLENFCKKIKEGGKTVINNL